jgi:RNA polymerase sigma factor (sigma-70 family)
MKKERESQQSSAIQGVSVSDAFVEHESAIKRFIAKFLPQPHDIEDVSQEAFLKAYAAEKRRLIAEPKSYLFRIAKHVAISQLRKNARRPTDSIESFDTLEIGADNQSAEDEAIAHQKFGIRCEAVATLSPQVRRAYLMRKVYGMTHKEIAERLGIARSTVEKHLIKGVMLCERYVRERSDEENTMTDSPEVKGR